MAPYYYLHDALFFLEQLSPTLAESIRRRSFEPCRALCAALLAKNPPADSVIHAVCGGVPFDRTLWHAFAGECLVHGADAIPRVPIDAETLCCLLGSPRGQTSAQVTLANASGSWGRMKRGERWLSGIEQALFGGRDLCFGGGFYRPDEAGLNLLPDVCRLAAYLQAVDPAGWTENDLAPRGDLADAAERTEEVEYARDWWPALVEMYVGAADAGQVIVCEAS
jgi:hypothetical protein